MMKIRSGVFKNTFGVMVNEKQHKTKMSHCMASVSRLFLFYMGSSVAFVY